MLGRGDGFTLDAAACPPTPTPTCNGDPVHGVPHRDVRRARRRQPVVERAATCRGTAAAWTASSRAADGAHREHGVLRRHRPALLLRPRQHLPGVRPLVLLGARRRPSRTGATSRRPPRSASCRPTSTRCSPPPTRPTASSGTGSTTTASPGTTTPSTCADILLFPNFYARQQVDHVKTFHQFLARLRQRHAAAGEHHQPRRQARTPRSRPPTSRSARPTAPPIINARDAEPALGEDRDVLHVRRARRLLRPRAAARGRRRPTPSRRASRSRPTSPAPSTATACACPAFVISPVRQGRLRVARGARPHVGPEVHRDQVQPRRA